MRKALFTSTMLLLGGLPLLLLAAGQRGTASFFRESSGSGALIPITSATFQDKVFFRVEIDAVDGEHSLEFNVYDGNGREVLYAERVVVASGNTVTSVMSYGYDVQRDAPGTWWYVAALDNEVALSRSLKVDK